MSKFEMKMKEQAFEDVYDPTELRFEPVAPVPHAVSATLEAEMPGATGGKALEVENLEEFVLECVATTRRVALLLCLCALDLPAVW